MKKIIILMTITIGSLAINAQTVGSESSINDINMSQGWNMVYAE